jgi:predicted porin
MKKMTVLAAAVLSAMSGGALAQSSTTNVQIYGIMDAGVRFTTNSGPTTDTKNKSTKEVIPGGMSQSRLGFNVSEDIGNGMSALVNMEHRLLSDTGAAASTSFWQQSWLGLKTPYGQLNLGRQYNVLFDIYTSTFASFKYSPYIETYKPELGFSLGARNSNMAKYLVEMNGFRVELQASPSEGSSTGGQSYGGLVRYEQGPFAVGAAYEVLRDGASNDATATVIGGSYTLGPWYFNLAWARNSFDAGFDPATISTLLGNGGTNGTFALGDVDHRDMYALGVTYQFTPQFNLGGHYWHARQEGETSAGDGKGNFFAAVADYALSKRTDVYLELDHTKFSDGITYANGATTRTGYTAGIRHRF